MGVHIDEPRRERQAGGAEGGPRRHAGEVPHGCNQFARNPDVRSEPGSAGAVKDGGALDFRVEHQEV